MRRDTDTIAAISTALGESGIGIVRISGSEAFPIADRVLDKPVSGAVSHTVHYRHVMHSGEILDEVLVTVMHAPHTYTGEDAVEINCHGGVLVVKRVLEEVYRAGAEPAEPGEFSKRAFLNRKMDLSQAEAVMDVIEAKNQYALKAAMNQLSGGLSREVHELRETVLNETAWIEAALDDPEHYDLTGYPQELRAKLVPLKARIEKLIRNAENGKVMKEGISTVILGRPNAGKSSLLNLLAGEDRAIVTDVAGTTRDTLTEQIRLADLSLNLTDTAGIRESRDAVEQIGVERAKSAAEEADLILLVLDSSEVLTDDDRKLLSYCENRPAVVLLNKTDLTPAVRREEVMPLTSHKVILFSAKDGTGLNELEDEVKSLFYHGVIDFNDQIYVTSARHRAALEKALHALEMVEKSIDSGMPEDFFSIDLQDAYEALGTITGETVEDDVVDRIFSRFCTGK